MPVAPNQVGKVIFIGIFKVLNQATPKWAPLRTQPIKQIFQNIANPTSWPDFFLEATATAIQQEFIVRGSYCPDLEATLKTYKGDNKTWSQLETYARRRMRSTTVIF